MNAARGEGKTLSVSFRPQPESTPVVPTCPSDPGVATAEFPPMFVRCK